MSDSDENDATDRALSAAAGCYRVSTSSHTGQQQRSPGQVTRTLRLTEAENSSSRETTPVARRHTIESLSNRPRSNPQSRTPMRYESPLGDVPDELLLRREASLESRGSDNSSDHREQRSSPVRQGHRITIRPLAGAAVGAGRTTRIAEERPITPKSRKQGPSHRKIRRWNNEKFAALAAEIASSSKAAAHALLKAHEEASLHEAIFDHSELKRSSLTRFMEDDKYTSLRDRFFEGEIPGPQQPQTHSSRRDVKPLNAQDRMNLMDPRLRRVVLRACANSYPASKVVQLFEKFLFSTFADDKTFKLEEEEEEVWWKDLLLEAPSMTKHRDSSQVVQFFFDAASSTGGFHRLLLHALCQFHSLRAVSRMVDIVVNNDTTTQSRALTVTWSTETKIDTRYSILDVAGRN